MRDQIKRNLVIRNSSTLSQSCLADYTFKEEPINKAMAKKSAHVSLGTGYVNIQLPHFRKSKDNTKVFQILNDVEAICFNMESGEANEVYSGQAFEDTIQIESSEYDDILFAHYSLQ